MVVALNRFYADSAEEIKAVEEICLKHNVRFEVSDGFAKGSEGTTSLAEKVTQAVSECNTTFKPTYNLEDDVRTKIQKISSTVYGAKYVIFSNKAKKQLEHIRKMGYCKMPVCMAKTQKSLSDDEKLLGRPENFDINIREFEIAAGAGFIIPIAGKILRMPGLPEVPAAAKMDIDEDGNIKGLS